GFDMVILNRRAILPLLTLLLGACAMPRKENPEVDPNTLGDVEFQGYLADVPLVTVDEAYRAMLILADGEDTSKTFDERREKLESRGIARPQWGLRPENIVDKGTVAFMVCRICKIRGGVNMHVFGALGLGDRRYAMREVVYEKLMDESSDYG